MLGRRNLRLKLSVKLSLLLLIVSRIIRSVIIHHFWSKVDKSLFDILDYFFAIVVKLGLVEIIDLLVQLAVIVTW